MKPKPYSYSLHSPRSRHLRIAAAELWPSQAHLFIAALALLLALVSPSLSVAAPGIFVNATGTANVQYVQHNLDQTQLTQQQNFSGAAAAGDFDGDGWVDLFVTRLDDTDILYRNLGGEFDPGEAVRFEDVTAAAGLTLNLPSNGAAWGDIDNDGDLDLYISTMYHPRFYMYVNNGDGTFTEEGIERGTALPSELDHIGSSVSFGDYDRDGWLDIHTNDWGISTKDPRAKDHSVLLRNRGAEAPGHFENVTEAAGVTILNEDNTQYGFTTAFTDLDLDGWPDLLVIGDHVTVNLFWNNGDGTFYNGTAEADVNQAIASMGLAIGDYNQDGLLDLYVTSTLDNRLYENQGDRTFVNRASEFGISNADWGWGTAFIDMENDRDLDIIMTNGFYDSNNPPEGNLVFTVDRMRLWENIDGVFTESANEYGVTDTRQGKGLLKFDYDRDGDLDIFVVNNNDKAILYQNQLNSGFDWLQLELQGTRSNRQGIGAKVWLTANEGEDPYLEELSGDSHFQGQSEKIVHYGLGPSQEIVDAIRIEWPSGIIQILEDVDSNQRLLVVEPEEGLVEAPQILSQSLDTTIQKDKTLELKVVSSLPLPVFIWYKDGTRIEGANGPAYTIKSAKFFDAGQYTVQAINTAGVVASDPITVNVDWDISRMSVARAWNEVLLDAIRKDFPAPTIHSRNLYHTSAAMWDAFWAYEIGGWDQALPAFHKETMDTVDFGSDRIEAQKEAISYATYRILYQRYKDSIGKDYTLPALRWLMIKLGYDANLTDTAGSNPSAVGNRIGYAIINQTLSDGSNEANAYADTTGYIAKNLPLDLNLSGTDLAAPNAWQPLKFDFRITQNGIEIGGSIQEFIGSNWQAVETFAIEKNSDNQLAIDPGPPPLLGEDSQQAFLDDAVEVIRFSSYLDPDLSGSIDISPGALLNNRLGANAGEGRSLNPITGLAYEPNLVNHADYGRILAEFWADGPSSETPPGHWNALHNEITDDPRFQRRYAGVGPELSPLEWDIHAYLAINGAMHDAAIAAWTLKRQYDYVRPISIIRYLGALGQSTNPAGPSYHPQGLPLEPGLVEVITAESSATGQPHATLSEHIGEIAIYAWTGEPQDPHTQVGGVDWIRAVDWLPYQRDTFVTPAFAAYVSGHSTFSRSAAEIMTLLTGSSFFPGGMGEFAFDKSAYLEFEDGPSKNVTLQWATYYDAADQAGISRLYGGIHVRADDFVGRKLGAQIGLESFIKAHRMRYGALPTSGLDNIRLFLGPQSPGYASLVEIGSAESQPPLTIRQTAQPFEALPEGPAIYIRPNLDAPSQVAFALQDAPIAKLVAWPKISGPENPVETHFEIKSDTPHILLIRGLGENAAPLSDTLVENPKLEVFQVDDPNSPLLIASNTDWITDERASLAEVAANYLNIKSIEHGSSDAALVVTLGKGKYLLRLSNAQQAPGQSQVEIHLLR